MLMTTRNGVRWLRGWFVMSEVERANRVLRKIALLTLLTLGSNCNETQTVGTPTAQRRR